MTRRSVRRDDVLVWCALAAIVLLATYVRFRGLGADSLWRDEAASWLQAQGSVFDIVAATAADNYPPLHNFLLSATMLLLGDSEWALRLPSAVFGVLTVVAVFWVGAMIGGRVAGLLGALLVALSAFHIWYSQEARMYALLALAATLFVGTSIRLTAKPTPAMAVLVFLTGACLLYAHPYGALAWLSIAAPVAVLTARRTEASELTLLRWGALQAAILAVFLPWAWILMQRAGALAETGTWIPYPTLRFAVGQISELLSGPLTLFAIVLVACMALIHERVLRPLELGGATPPSPALAIAPPTVIYVLIAWAVGPIALGLLGSILVTPAFIARYAIVSLPAILILAGIGLARFVTGWTALAAAAVVASGISWWGLATGSPEPREDWRGAAELFAETFRPSNCLLMPSRGGLRALSYYYREPIDCVAFASSRRTVDLASLRADLIFVVLFGPGDRGADVMKAFPSPPWDIGGEVPYRGINVIAMVRRPR